MVLLAVPLALGLRVAPPSRVVGVGRGAEMVGVGDAAVEGLAVAVMDGVAAPVAEARAVVEGSREVREEAEGEGEALPPSAEALE